jgi:hypothetical protein
LFPKKHHRIHLFLFLFTFLYVTVPALAQYEQDTTYLISEDYAIDTVSGPIQQIEPGEDLLEDEEGSYFDEKSVQANGGGPDIVRFRKLNDSFVATIRRDDAFWYVNYSFEKKKAAAKERESKPFMQQPLAQTILWLLIIAGFIAFLIIYLSNSNVGLFRKANRSIANDSDSDEIPENIFEINYQKQLDRAIQKKDFRLATRLMFLQLLKDLSNKNIIRYQQDRTNFDYLMQLHGTKYYEDFFRLTRNYEYAWYGLFDISDSKFDLIKQDFDKMNTQLK